MFTPAFAQTAGAAPSAGDMIAQFAPFLLILIIMYFLLIRPQQRRAKEHQELIKNIRRGDVIVTTGGLIGKVTKVEEGVVEVELAPGMKVRALKSTLTDIVDPLSAKPAND